MRFLHAVLPLTGLCFTTALSALDYTDLASLNVCLKTPGALCRLVGYQTYDVRFWCPGCTDCPTLSGGYCHTLGPVANNVTFEGAGVDRYSTVLRRSSSAPLVNYSPIMLVTGSYVTIRNVSFDGARYAFYGGCPPHGVDIYDLRVGPGITSSAYVSNASFRNGIGASIWLKGGYVYNADLYLARSTLLELHGDHRDSGATAFADAYNSLFYWAGTAAIAVHGRSSWVMGNILSTNRYEMSDGYGGGQLYLEQTSGGDPIDPEAFGATVINNTIDGGGWKYIPNVPNPTTACHPSFIPNEPQLVSGVEMYGNNHRLINNEVKYNTGDGVGATKTQDVTLAGIDTFYGGPTRPVHSNGEASKPDAAGIRIHNGLDINQNITLISVNSLNNYGDGVNVAPYTSGPGYSGVHCLQAYPGYNPFFPPDGAGLALSNKFPTNQCAPPPSAFAMRLNVGGGQVTDGNGRVWNADGGSGFSGVNVQVFTNSSYISNVSQFSSRALYQTMRYGAGGTDFYYTSYVPQGSYAVTLKFADPGQPPGSTRRFSVYVQGGLWLDSFEIQLAAGGYNRAVDYSTVVNSVPDQNGLHKITLSFIRWSADPMVNAIQIVPYP